MVYSNKQIRKLYERFAEISWRLKELSKNGVADVCMVDLDYAASTFGEMCEIYIGVKKMIKKSKALSIIDQEGEYSILYDLLKVDGRINLSNGSSIIKMFNDMSNAYNDLTSNIGGDGNCDMDMVVRQISKGIYKDKKKQTGVDCYEDSMQSVLTDREAKAQPGFGEYVVQKDNSKEMVDADHFYVSVLRDGMQVYFPRLEKQLDVLDAWVSEKENKLVCQK